MKKENVKAAVEGVKHSMETAGFEVTEEHTKLVTKQLNNEINEEEFLQEVRKRVNQKGK